MSDLWFAWCDLHRKWEPETEYLNCHTRQYLTRFPGITAAVFGEGVTGVQPEDNPAPD